MLLNAKYNLWRIFVVSDIEKASKLRTMIFFYLFMLLKRFATDKFGVEIKKSHLKIQKC